MKRIFILVLIMFSVALNAQSKDVKLSDDHAKLFKIMKSSNSFSSFPDLPAIVTEVYDCGQLKYTIAEASTYTLKIMPDNEFIINMKSSKRVYYLRFPEDTVFGYSLTEDAKGTQVDVYRGNLHVYDKKISREFK